MRHLTEQWSRLAMPMNPPPEMEIVATDKHLWGINPAALAVIDGKVIGYLSIWLTGPSLYRMEWETDMMWVEPEYRRKGIGTLLYAKVRQMEPSVKLSGDRTKDAEAWVNSDLMADKGPADEKYRGLSPAEAEQIGRRVRVKYQEVYDKHGLAKAAKVSVPFPKVPFGAKVNTASGLDRDAWFHYSTTGKVPGPMVHAGTLNAARSRMNSLYKFDLEYRAEDFHTQPPSHWRPQYGAHGTFVLRLKTPPANDRQSLISDDEAQGTFAKPMLYRNDYEDSSYPSIVGPISAFEIIGFSYDDTNFWEFTPRPLAQAEEVAKAFSLYKAQYRAWDVSLESQDEGDEDEDSPWRT